MSLSLQSVLPASLEQLAAVVRERDAAPNLEQRMRDGIRAAKVPGAFVAFCGESALKSSAELAQSAARLGVASTRSGYETAQAQKRAFQSGTPATWFNKTRAACVFGRGFATGLGTCAWPLLGQEVQPLAQSITFASLSAATAWFAGSAVSVLTPICALVGAAGWELHQVSEMLHQLNLAAEAEDQAEAEKVA